MKPVLRTVIDKNGNEELVFTPSARMILFSIEKAKGLSDKDACEKAGIDAQLPLRWKMKYKQHYADWIEEAVDHAVVDDAAVLERVGMVNALQGNYQFWRDMARTKGVIKEEQPKQGLTVNTNFTQILVAVGGDLNAARQRLLSAARGLGDPGGPGMVVDSGERERAGAGNRAGDVQGEPVAVANALGTDRGRAE